jgi:ribonuclease HI
MSKETTSSPILDDALVIWSDGSSLGNPGPGGYGVIIASKKFGEVIELAGSKVTTTNNEMEMTAVVAALSYAINNTQEVHIFTDSSYLIQGVTTWMYGWKRNNWAKADGEEIKNRFLWETIYSLVGERGRNTLHWHHVPSHVGIPGNERVDTLAREYAAGNHLALFRGKLDDYTIPGIFEFPNTAEAKEKKSSSKKSGVAHSYLSEVDGIIQRHKTWAECEARVKGKKARYQKALSEGNEGEILEKWGFTISDIS